MTRWYLYCITNRINGKRYIGITVSPVGRKWKHFNNRGSTLVANAISKYGVDALIFDVLLNGTRDEIVSLEQHYIETWNTIAPNGYNLTAGGEGALQCRRSPETRQKMSDSHKGKSFSDQHRRRIGDASRDRLKRFNHLVAARKSRSSVSKPGVRIIIGDRCFASLKEAALAFNISYKTFTKRFYRLQQSATERIISDPADIATLTERVGR